MIENDTIRLLRECDAGIRMGIESIGEVVDKAKSKGLRNILDSSKDGHEALLSETETLLAKYGDDGKEPNLMAQSMSRLKTGARLTFDPYDESIADLMTDGCNMGVKSLSRYLNQYKAADEASKDLAKRVISEELKLTEELRPFL